MSASARHRNPRRRARRWIVGLGVLVVTGACTLLLVGIALSAAAPDWWRQPDPTNPRTIQKAEDVETGVVNVIYEVRDDPQAPWSVTLRAPDANAWLNTRLEQWLANADAEFDWPSELESLQVEFDDGLIQVGVEVRDGDKSRILSATLRPSLHEDGSLWVLAETIRVGRLPIPAGWLADRAGAIATELAPRRFVETPEVDRLLRALIGDRPLEAEPIVELGDGRRVRLLGIETSHGKLRVTCRTELK
ncbi:MAG: hypothetical protein IPJ41_01065 [Phycisphaerales bacterium]|nr:hypothetical protein [Phycisphaerales bacterium]